MDTSFQEYPSNQEQYQQMQAKRAEEDDFDYSLNLSGYENQQHDTKQNHAECVSAACNTFDAELNERHQIACAREGISYGQSNGNMPPFMKYNVYCHPNLGNTAINTEFQTYVKSQIEDYKKKFNDNIINFMDSKIEASNDKLKQIRTNALNTIGNDNTAEVAINEMTKRMKGSKEIFDQKLLEFKTNIRLNKPHGHSERKLPQHGRRPTKTRHHPY